MSRVSFLDVVRITCLKFQKLVSSTMAPTWFSPATRTELIENLVSGVGMVLSLMSDLFSPHFRSLQPFKRWYPRGLSVPSDTESGI